MGRATTAKKQKTAVSTIISCYVKVVRRVLSGIAWGNQNGIFFFSIENKNLTLTPLNGG